MLTPLSANTADQRSGTQANHAQPGVAKDDGAATMPEAGLCGKPAWIVERRSSGGTAKNRRQIRGRSDGRRCLRGKPRWPYVYPGRSAACRQRLFIGRPPPKSGYIFIIDTYITTKRIIMQDHRISSNQNVLPWPRRLSTPYLAACMSRIPFTIESPSPVPALSRTCSLAL